MIVATLLQFKQIRFSNWVLSLQVVGTIINGIFILTFPITVPTFLSFRYDDLIRNKPFRKLWGGIYFGLVGNLEEAKSSIAYIYPAFFFTRRAIFGALAILLRDWFAIQYVFFFVTSYAAIFMAIQYKPFKIASANWIEVLNEVTAAILAYHIMGFGGYVE